MLESQEPPISWLGLAKAVLYFVLQPQPNKASALDTMEQSNARTHQQLIS